MVKNLLDASKRSEVQILFYHPAVVPSLELGEHRKVEGYLDIKRDAPTECSHFKFCGYGAESLSFLQL